ncbi:unnamed protein product [Staurois parvus]|uniref:Uncharacterized protein n=1 Tax=Staurois parvus TaxID=386267 RepID=A0ABN9GZ33_9NEOB|nr:unnamed protein product [Staurois parvus]
MQAGQSTRDKMYVKWFETEMTVFQICRLFLTRTSRRSQGPEHGSRMPALAGGDGRERSRGRIVGAKDKVSAAGNP